MAFKPGRSTVAIMACEYTTDHQPAKDAAHMPALQPERPAAPLAHDAHEVRAAWIEATRLRTLPLAASGSLVAAGIAIARGA